jgi:hypothetical protein
VHKTACDFRQDVPALAATDSNGHFFLYDIKGF